MSECTEPTAKPTAITTTGAHAVAEYLEARGAAFELVEHEPTMSAAAAAAATRHSQSEVAKTIVLRDGAGYVLAVIPASERLDLHKVRDLLGASRSLQLAGEDEIAHDFRTLEVGAVASAGPRLPAAELIDQRLLEADRVLCAGGDHRHAIVLAPREIVRLTDARVADICAD
jgi:Ala-tRNA(Pro) deacylase